MALTYPSLPFGGQGIWHFPALCFQKPISLEQSCAEGVSDRSFDMSFTYKLGGG